MPTVETKNQDFGVPVSELESMLPLTEEHRWIHESANQTILNGKGDRAQRVAPEGLKAIFGDHLVQEKLNEM
jgi:hypothetical protein